MFSFVITVDSRYLDLSYLESPLISKWKSGPCFNMGNLTPGNKILWNRGEIAPNFSSFPQYFEYMSNFRSQITYLFC